MANAAQRCIQLVPQMVIAIEKFSVRRILDAEFVRIFIGPILAVHIDVRERTDRPEGRLLVGDLSCMGVAIIKDSSVHH